jgi:probable HAF family extracellular repeat protein
MAIDLGVWPGGHYSVANGINNLGQIVGTGTVAGDNLDHALMWIVDDGSPTPTPTPTSACLPRHPAISAHRRNRDTRARGRFQRVFIAIYVREARWIIKWEQGD